MNVLSAYTGGLKTAMKHHRMALFLYGINLVLVLVLARAFYGTIQTGMLGSMSVEKLLLDFDYTVYQDFMNHYGDRVQPLIGAAMWLGLFYAFLNVFLVGGILHTLSEDLKFSFQTFLAGCGKYFGRFFRLTCFMILFQMLIQGVIFGAFAAAFNAQRAADANEITLFYIIASGFSVHGLFFFLLVCISDYAKIVMVRTDSHKALRAMFGAIKFTLRHFLKTYGLFLLLLLFPFVLGWLYLKLSEIINMSTPVTILLMLLIQQTYIYLRIWSGVWFLASELALYDGYHPQEASKTTWKGGESVMETEEEDPIFYQPRGETAEKELEEDIEIEIDEEIDEQVKDDETSANTATDTDSVEEDTTDTESEEQDPPEGEVSHDEEPNPNKEDDDEKKEG